jgi:type IV secretory pathway VirB2 component (pilin)
MKLKSPLMKWRVSSASAASVLTLALPARAFAAIAAGALPPWDSPLPTLQPYLQGPLAHGLTIAAIIGSGIIYVVSKDGTGARRIATMAVGGGAALAGLTLTTMLFPAASALF